MLDGGEELTVGTAGTADVLKCLDKFLFLPAITEAGVEVRGRQTEEPLVLVRSAAVSRLLVLEVGEHRLQQNRFQSRPARDLLSIREEGRGLS